MQEKRNVTKSNGKGPNEEPTDPLNRNTVISTLVTTAFLAGVCSGILALLYLYFTYWR